MRASSFSLFSFSGIPVRVHASWFLLGALVMGSLATGWFPLEAPSSPPALNWLAGAVGAAGLFISIALHELSHALVGRSQAIPVKTITMFLFGGVAQLEGEPGSPRAELLMAIAGPLASLVLAAVFFLLETAAITLGLPSLLRALLAYLASINVVVAVFNMLPGYPLDGGRVLRAALWHYMKDIVRATRVASGIGQLFGLFIIALGFTALLRGELVSAIWSAVVGLMLMGFARSSYVQLVIRRELHGKPAASLMDTHPDTVVPSARVSELMREYVNHEDHSVFPVVDESRTRLIGLVDPLQARRFPKDQWSAHAVSEIFQLGVGDHQIGPDADAQLALERMSQSGYRELLVVEGGKLLGVLRQSAILRSIRLGGPARS